MKYKLLVHRTYPKRIVEPCLLDRTNDPEMRRGLPLTFGNCRPNVRRQAHVGDVLVFIGYVPEGRILEEQYFLDAWFKIAEILEQPEAMQRFGSHPNLLIEPWTVDTPEDATTTLNGVQVRHARNDDHEDWVHRVQPPYLVSDTVESRTIRPGIPWAELVAQRDQLRHVDKLRNGFNRHPATLLTEEDAAFLRAFIQTLPPEVNTLPQPDRLKGPRLQPARGRRGC